ncbi:hypothetical protein BLNAU_4381 [Blattamonas nauphoetae]|uniref:Uncharacterized protein n=1 Tax=Blattamonas nauphoetae TaxID=2049346 RepID=A0ABQ9YAM2_9EUKA|nr:hypothetical protein BLNAU_4381 [Blattamonas nauphoetae]
MSEQEQAPGLRSSTVNGPFEELQMIGSSSFLDDSFIFPKTPSLGDDINIPAYFPLEQMMLQVPSLPELDRSYIRPRSAPLSPIGPISRQQSFDNMSFTTDISEILSHSHHTHDLPLPLTPSDLSFPLSRFGSSPNTPNLFPDAYAPLSARHQLRDKDDYSLGSSFPGLSQPGYKSQFVNLSIEVPSDSTDLEAPPTALHIQQPPGTSNVRLETPTEQPQTALHRHHSSLIQTEQSVTNPGVSFPLPGSDTSHVDNPRFHPHQPAHTTNWTPPQTSHTSSTTSLSISHPISQDAPRFSSLLQNQTQTLPAEKDSPLFSPPLLLNSPQNLTAQPFNFTQNHTFVNKNVPYTNQSQQTNTQQHSSPQLFNSVHARQLVFVAQQNSLPIPPPPPSHKEKPHSGVFTPVSITFPQTTPQVSQALPFDIKLYSEFSPSVPATQQPRNGKARSNPRNPQMMIQPPIVPVGDGRADVGVDKRFSSLFSMPLAKTLSILASSEESLSSFALDQRGSLYLQKQLEIEFPLTQNDSTQHKHRTASLHFTKWEKHPHPPSQNMRSFLLPSSPVFSPSHFSTIQVAQPIQPQPPIPNDSLLLSLTVSLLPLLLPSPASQGKTFLPLDQYGNYLFQRVVQRIGDERDKSDWSSWVEIVLNSLQTRINEVKIPQNKNISIQSPENADFLTLKRAVAILRNSSPISHPLLVFTVLLTNPCFNLTPDTSVPPRRKENKRNQPTQNTKQFGSDSSFFSLCANNHGTRCVQTLIRCLKEEMEKWRDRKDSEEKAESVGKNKTAKKGGKTTLITNSVYFSLASCFSIIVSSLFDLSSPFSLPFFTSSSDQHDREAQQPTLLFQLDRALWARILPLSIHHILSDRKERKGEEAEMVCVGIVPLTPHNQKKTPGDSLLAPLFHLSTTVNSSHVLQNVLSAFPFAFVVPVLLGMIVEGIGPRSEKEKMIQKGSEAPKRAPDGQNHLIDSVGDWCLSLNVPFLPFLVPVPDAHSQIPSAGGKHDWFVSLCQNQFGCCVVQRCVEVIHAEFLKQTRLDEARQEKWLQTHHTPQTNVICSDFTTSPLSDDVFCPLSRDTVVSALLLVQYLSLLLVLSPTLCVDQFANYVYLFVLDLDWSGIERGKRVVQTGLRLMQSGVPLSSLSSSLLPPSPSTSWPLPHFSLNFSSLVQSLFPLFALSESSFYLSLLPSIAFLAQQKFSSTVIEKVVSKGLEWRRKEEMRSVGEKREGSVSDQMEQAAELHTNKQREIGELDEDGHFWQVLDTIRRQIVESDGFPFIQGSGECLLGDEHASITQNPHSHPPPHSLITTITPFSATILLIHSLLSSSSSFFSLSTHTYGNYVMQRNASPLFLSVVQTIKEGNILDDTAMHEAESVIQKLIEVVKKPFTATHLLSMIVPTPNRSPAGFCEAMLTLLTSGHQSLEALSLQLLRHCLSHIPRESHLAFIRTGFFTQLAPTIERIANMMIPESHADFLRSILLCARDCLPEPIQRLPRVSHLPIDSIRQIVFDQLLQPVGPYISWCCENRLALEAATLDLSRLESLLLVFLQLSVFHEQTLRFSKRSRPTVFEFGEQISAIAPIPAPQSLKEAPQFLTEIGKLGKADFAPLAAVAKNHDGAPSQAMNMFALLPPPAQAQVFNNLLVLIGGLPNEFAETLPPIFKKSFPVEVVLKRAVRASFTDPNLLPFKLAAVVFMPVNVNMYFMRMNMPVLINSTNILQGIFPFFTVHSSFKVFMTVMKWYIECILGVESRFNLGLADSPLQVDDIVVDNLFQFHINPLPSFSASPNGEESTYSISSEIQNVSKYIHKLITSLNKHHLILVPTINPEDLFHSIRVSAITSLVDATHLPSDIIADLSAFQQLKFPYLTHRLSQRLPDSEKWTSVLLSDIEDWHLQKQLPGFDHTLLTDSLSLLLPTLLSESNTLLKNHEESHWDFFLDNLVESATGQRKEHSALFLAATPFKPARDSIIVDAESHFHTFQRLDQLRLNTIAPPKSESPDSEATTASYHSQPGPTFEGREKLVYAFKSGGSQSTVTSKVSSASNTTRSHQPPSTSPLDSQIQGGTWLERLFSSTEVRTIKLSPIHIEDARTVPLFPPEDELSKLSRQTEEERQIIDALRQLSAWAPNKLAISSNLLLTQDAPITQSPLNNEAQNNHQQERPARIPEWAENTLNNLRRNPLLAWHDTTSSCDSEGFLIERKTMKTLSSFVTSKCEAGEAIEWKDLMAWFMCAVIGLESRASSREDLSDFAWDDVVIDESGTAQIILRTSHSGSSPPPSPKSFSADLASLSKLFLSLIRESLNIFDTMCTEKLVLVCAQSVFEGKLREFSVKRIQKYPNDLDLPGTLHTLIKKIYKHVFKLENEGLINPTGHMTEIDCDYQSPEFTITFEPELVKLKEQFDPDLFEEAKRVMSWMELLQKVAFGEEVLADISFLKSSIFGPTLLSLQEKFQRLTWPVDGFLGTVNRWEENSPPTSPSEAQLDSSTESLSVNSSPHDFFESRLEPSFQAPSSSSRFQQKSFQLQTIFHALYTSHPTSLAPSHSFQSELYPEDTFLESHTRDINPTEKFSSKLFDEEDDEKLVRSLIRCRSVCGLVGAEKCILGFHRFVDQTVSCIGTSNPRLRRAASSLFDHLIDTSSVIPLLPHHWNRLRFAFRDGWPEEQIALLRISSKWIESSLAGHYLLPFPATQFDWDGLMLADLRPTHALISSVFLIISLHHRAIQDEIGRDEATRIILSFERHQHAVSRIVPMFPEFVRSEPISHSSTTLISYCLLVSLQSNCDFPPTLTNFLKTHPEIDVNALLPFQNNLVFLCHSALSGYQQDRPPLDLIFERVLRTNPLDFFLHPSQPDVDLPPSILNTALCGFHALCHRRAHLNLMESEAVWSVQPLLNSHWLFNTPLITHTFPLFLCFPPPLVVRFFLPALSSKTDRVYLVSLLPALKLMMSTLLIVTAPFGDSHSLKELFRSSQQQSTDDVDRSHELMIVSRCMSLEMLNIPTGFESALVRSNTRVSHDLSDHRNNQSTSFEESRKLSKFRTPPDGFLSKELSRVSDRISHFASWIQHLNQTSPLIVWKDGFPSLLCRLLLSPVPAEVSVVLEFVKRVVCLSSARILVLTAHWGLLDIVIRAVSKSSFLEDYENGIFCSPSKGITQPSTVRKKSSTMSNNTTIPFSLRMDPSIIPHTIASQNAAVQQFLEFGEQISAIAPIPAPKSLEQAPQFLFEIAKLGKADFAPLAAIAKNLDGAPSQAKNMFAHLPPSEQAQVFNNVVVTCATQKLSFPSTMTNFYVSQSDMTVDQLIGGLPNVFAETLPPIFKKSFAWEVVLERAVRASFTDVNILTFKLAAVTLNSFVPESHFETIHPLLRILSRGSNGRVYGPNDEHTAQLFQDLLVTDFSQEIRRISTIFTELNRTFCSPSHFKAWMQYFNPIQPFFSLLYRFCQDPPKKLSFLHHPIFVPSFHDLHISFLELNPGPSEGEHIQSSLFPSPFELTSIKDPNSAPPLHKFFTKLCTFPGESSILMAFQDISPNFLGNINNILHPPPGFPHSPRPFLLPLSEPRQSEDGTIFLRSLGNMMPLSNFTEFLVSRKIPIVMKWFIECILGVESRFNLGLADSPLQVDDIVVDNLFRFHINQLPSFTASQNGKESLYSVSSEIQHVSKYFVHLIANLNKNHLIFVSIIPTRGFFHTLLEIASGKQKEHTAMFLTDDIYKPARDSLFTGAEIHHHYLGGNDHFLSKITVPHPIEITNSEAATVSFPSQARSLATHTYSGPSYERVSFSIYALKSITDGSTLTAIHSLGSNKSGSSQNLTPNPMSPQLQDGLTSGQLFSSTEMNPVILSPIDMGINQTVPDFTPEDEKSKLSRQIEEERAILDSLHQQSSWAPKKRKLLSKLSVFQDFANTSRLRQFEMGAFNTSQVKQFEMDAATHQGESKKGISGHAPIPSTTPSPLAPPKTQTKSQQVKSNLTFQPPDECIYHEIETLSIHSLPRSLATHSQFPPIYERGSVSVCAMESEVNGSKIPTIYSLESNGIGSSRTLTPNDLSPQDPDGSISGPLSSSTEIYPFKLENAHTDPEIMPEDETPKLSWQTEEENFTVDTSEIQQFEMDECDTTASEDCHDSLVESESMRTLSSLVTSKCEAKEVIEWQDLMEWFVCAVIALESRASGGDDLGVLDWDDVVVDQFGVVRLHISTSPSISSPPPSPQSFSGGLSSLSKLFLDLIDRLSTSHCLPVHLSPYYLDKLITSILLHLIHHLISTAALIPTDSTLPPRKVPTPGVVGGLVKRRENTLSAQDYFPLLLTLHSLLTSPLQSSLTKYSPTNTFGQLFSPVPSHIFISQESFNTTIFDEDDDERLAQSLISCNSVCERLGADNCIQDISEFIDRTISALGTSNFLVRMAASFLFDRLVELPSVLSRLPNQWNRLRSAFRDGQSEEQYAILLISTKWIVSSLAGHDLPPFPVTQFDWEGLMFADLRQTETFVSSIRLIVSLHRRAIKYEFRRDEMTDIVLSFEKHQNAVSRIRPEFDDIKQGSHQQDCLWIVSYCLLVSLLSNCDFPPTITNYLTDDPEIDISAILPFQNHHVFLCHTSLSGYQQDQPPLDLIFEQILRTNALDFFLHPSRPDFDHLSSIHNTALCGFHALCRRGMHLDLINSKTVQSEHHLVSSFWLFNTPLITHTFHLFLYFPPPLVVHFFLPILRASSDLDDLLPALKVMMTTLLFVTAPFGDCRSVKELYRSIQQPNNNKKDSSAESIVAARCESLELLNIPTGFGLPLANPNSRQPVDPFENHLKSHISFDTSQKLSHHSSRMPSFLSDETRSVSGWISLVGFLIQWLDMDSPLIVFENGNHQMIWKALLSVLFSLSFLQFACSSRSELLMNEALVTSPFEEVDPTEKFSSSFFDMSDDEILAQSLICCNANSSLFDQLVGNLYVIHQLPDLLTRLRIDFRDGSPEEQRAILQISTNMINAAVPDGTQPHFHVEQFDRNGLFSADLSWRTLLFASIHFVMALRRCSIEGRIRKDVATRIILSFEQHQHVVS